ncbi:MAG: hypothetical protein AB7N73_05680 [Gemmatimonadales bacterium]
MLAFPDVGSAVDVVLVTDSYYAHDAASQRAVTPIESALQIGDNIWLGPVPDELEERICRACEPPGEAFDPVRQYHFPYALYKLDSGMGAEEDLSFDSNLRLQTAIVLSRLVHPTAAGLTHAARLRRTESGEAQIVPKRQWGIDPGAYVVRENEDWLVPADAPQIHELMTAFERAKPPARVLTALWHLEAAFHTHFIDLRWPILTTALEALVRIPDEQHGGRFVGSTKCFVDRMVALGQIESTLVVSESDLKAMYSHRSQYTHGLRPQNLTLTARALYERQEEVCRQIIRRAILDNTFGGIFATDATIKSAMPLR